MPQAFEWTVIAPGVNNKQAIELAKNYWTSQGFTQHDSSHNRLVYRCNGYGRLGSWFNTAVSTGNIDWDHVPTELEILVQVVPAHAKYALIFRVSTAMPEVSEKQFLHITRNWVDGFIKYNDQWTCQPQASR